MIQTATLPAASTQLRGAGGPAPLGDAVAFDVQFSALLAANFIAPMDMLPGTADAAPAPEMPFKAKLGLASGKQTGKAGGKNLPDSPALAAFAAMLKDLRAAASAKGVSGKGETASETVAAPSDQTAALAVSPDPAFFSASTANDNAATLPLPFAATPPAQSATIADARPALNERSADPRVQPASFSPDALNSIALLEPPNLENTGPEQTAPAPVSPSSAHPEAPESPSSAPPQSRLETMPVVIQSGLTTRVVLVPRIQSPFAELGKLQTMAIEQAKTGQAGAEIAKVQVRQMPEARTTSTLATIALGIGQTGAVTTEPAQALPRHSSESELAQETPRSAFTSLDAAPLLVVDPGTATDTAPTGATGPAALTTPSRTPDFAALIDRLVEARSAAQATSEPHTVSAAIEHADFGQVSLQFRQDAAGLSVVMASADPDLAKALQVAAPVGGSLAGQSASSGESNAAPWRGDQSAQSSASQSFGGQSSGNIGQPQSQAQRDRGQSQQRPPDQTFSAANPSPRSHSRSDQTQRSGIFA